MNRHFDQMTKLQPDSIALREEGARAHGTEAIF
jgi:hypothetical protein